MLLYRLEQLLTFLPNDKLSRGETVCRSAVRTALVACRVPVAQLAAPRPAVARLGHLGQTGGRTDRGIA